LNPSAPTAQRRHGPPPALALLLLSVLSLVIIGLYFGLLRAGRWQSDEYQLFFNQQRYGLHIFPARLLYSPRPFSEALIFLYGVAVEHMRRPLVATFLAALWSACLLAVVLAACQTMLATRTALLAAVALSLTIFAFVLVSSDVTEMFYWPVAAAAYVPMLSAAIVLVFQLNAPLTPARKSICAAALCVAATAHDMGAALAVGFALCIGLATVHGRVLRKEVAAGWGILWWLVPAMLGLGVLATDIISRVPVDVAFQSAQPYTGHVVASVGAGLIGFGLDVVTFNEASGWPAILLCLASRIMLAVGAALLLRACVPGPAGVNRLHMVLFGALAFAGLFSIAAAYHDYGKFCCERQSTARGGFIDLMFIIAALILLSLARWQPGRAGALWVGALLLVLSLAPAGLALPKIKTEYGMLNWAVTGRNRSWASGSAAGTTAMQFFLPPDSPRALINGTGIDVGTYPVDPRSQSLVDSIGRYFGKRTVIVCQPWQTDKSWLIDNKWIPACPSTQRP
jgi:hypothetical protein